jgi:hypothetical protein
MLAYSEHVELVEIVKKLQKMKEIIDKIEHKINELNIAKAKIRFPLQYPRTETDNQIFKLSNELLALKIEATQVNDIKTQTNLIFGQLSEYIETIEKPHILPYSKKQGLSFDMFYISPLISIKNIVFFIQNGLAGAIYNLTLDQKDSVTNEIQFLDFLRKKRSEVSKVTNLFELYEFYESFAESIKRDFC